MIRILANRSVWSNDVELLVASKGFDSQWSHVAEPMTLREHKPGELVEPTMRLDNTAAQELMDNLWHCGLRPSEGTGSAGSLKATQDHLADMRKIAFTFIKE